MQQDEDGHDAHGSYEIACPGESVEDVVQVGARLAEEHAEGAHLQQQHQCRDAHYQQRVDGALGHHGTQRLGE